MLDESDEAIRDLSRTREDAVPARHEYRQRLQAMPLRTGRRYSGRAYCLPISKFDPNNVLRQQLAEAESKVGSLANRLPEQEDKYFLNLETEPCSD